MQFILKNGNIYKINIIKFTFKRSINLFYKISFFLIFLNDSLNFALYNEHKNNKQLFIIIVINFFFNFRYKIILKIGQD